MAELAERSVKLVVVVMGQQVCGIARDKLFQWSSPGTSGN